MILAAGFGTRLGEATQDRPKALIDVAGRPVIDHVADRLIAAGVDRIIVNVHHHADLVIAHLRRRGDAEFVISREEPAPFETGGGILHAAPHFRGDGPILVHNVDVICDADFRALCQAHRAAGALATLAVHDRPSSRKLAFAGDQLVGRAGESDGRALAFAGIHVIEPALLDRMTERGTFSIMTTYLRLASEGALIRGHDIGDAQWLEIGTPARLEAARRALA